MGNHNAYILCLHLFSFLVLLTGTQVVQSSSHHQNHHSRYRQVGLSKLFVFGDSYADTGNNPKSVAKSWHEPYGITFPGRPTGRWSDGRVLTDYVASFIGIKSPIAYKWIKFGPKLLSNGINFAYGGTGVFNTLAPQPNMTTQINFFQKIIQTGVYSKRDLDSSLALVSLAGNDYGAYNARSGTAQGLPAFMASVVNQLKLNVKRIHEMGVKKVAVTTLQPLGCLPQNTLLSYYRHCNATQNMAVNFHNFLLKQAVQQLNNEVKNSTFLLDLHSAFMSVFKKRNSSGNVKFSNPLQPCCVGMDASNSCGSTDQLSGKKKYRVCKHPKAAFFWDLLHPSQAGWHAVSLVLHSSFNKLYS
ncbi:PREDICTED: GDSL esterase/lipase At5g03610-like isoform X2 [Nelumbo nucifera]|uniref:GDSL esterase/lipase At5g03610-like isoform X2 n=1 Tax=Nelumbo nucifera TaxID=4432 RepID=A0A1U7YV72_NELNU|nr:PREDICTED: GDSL esterase/lipase At5g03610-like isoform X2 [Nelumbo nucifera]